MLELRGMFEKDLEFGFGLENTATDKKKNMYKYF